MPPPPSPKLRPLTGSECALEIVPRHHPGEDCPDHDDVNHLHFSLGDEGHDDSGIRKTNPKPGGEKHTARVTITTLLTRKRR